MTAVLVHGVPETAALWRPLVGHLDRDDVVLLGLPGFGSALPEGFEPTMHHYADWLADELTTLEDVDLVAHDWGALLSLKVLAGRPANIRSWVLDVGDLSDDHRWHDMARLWQRPGDGEEFMEGMVTASTEDRAALLAGIGVPERGAAEMAAAFDRTMGEAILGLYRSATEIGVEWGPGIDAITGPGLVVESMQDPFRAPARAVRLAERTGAQIAELPDEGHWWMLQSPERAAEIITEFWASC